jgi:hypothetical protein
MLRNCWALEDLFKAIEEITGSWISHLLQGLLESTSNEVIQGLLDRMSSTLGGSLHTHHPGKPNASDVRCCLRLPIRERL